MQKNQNQTSLIIVKNSPFEKIRINLLKFIYGKDYKMIYNFENLIKVNRPKNVIIPKSCNYTKINTKILIWFIGTT